MNEQASTDPDRRRWVLQEIARDAEADVDRFEGQPFSGKTVAEYMGCQAAAIKALAEVVETLLPPELDERIKYALETLLPPYSRALEGGDTP